MAFKFSSKRKLLFLAATFVAATVSSAHSEGFYDKRVGDWFVFGQSTEKTALCTAMKNFGREGLVMFSVNPGDPDFKIKTAMEGNVSIPPLTDALKKALRACQWKFESLYNE